MIVRMTDKFDRKAGRRVINEKGYEVGIDIELFEACVLLDVPEAAAAWDASEIAGTAMPDLRGKCIRLYYGKRERRINGERVDDILLRMCVGLEQTDVNGKHHRFEWSRSLGWIDINKLEAEVRAATAVAEARARHERSIDRDDGRDPDAPHSGPGRAP